MERDPLCTSPDTGWALLWPQILGREAQSISVSITLSVLGIRGGPPYSTVLSAKTVQISAYATCQIHLLVVWGTAKRGEPSVILKFALSCCDTPKINNMYDIRVILLVPNCFYVCFI